MQHPDRHSSLYGPCQQSFFPSMILPRMTKVAIPGRICQLLIQISKIKKPRHNYACPGISQALKWTCLKVKVAGERDQVSNHFTSEHFQASVMAYDSRTVIAKFRVQVSMTNEDSFLFTLLQFYILINYLGHPRVNHTILDLPQTQAF